MSDLRPQAIRTMNEQQTALPISRATVDVPAGVDLPATTSAGQAASPASKLLEAAKWVISFPAMLAMFLVGRVFYEGRGFVVDPDVWWHIKVGQDILRTHLFPTIDSYSFTASGRSEEHTSELQSPYDLVCRLLLEKK